MSDSDFIVGGVSVSRETFDKLETLSALITKWTKSINLIAPATVPDIWNRHIEDSAQIYTLAKRDWAHWIDLGSGGGLPGLVISILDEGANPVTLIESDTRKCLFLNTARRELGLNLTVLNQRIEDSQTDKADVMTARALAPLPNLLAYCERLLKPNGTALFSKGAKYVDELNQAKKTWHFDVNPVQSITNTESRILEISRIRRRES